MSLTPSIYLVPGLKASNVYVFRSGSGELVLIDSGMPGNAKKIADFISSNGDDPITLSWILLTHPDIDHSGNVWELKEKYAPKAKIAIHKEDAPRLSGEKRLKEVKGATGMMINLLNPFLKFHPVEPDIELNDKETIAGLLTIHTPGHTQGSVCFYSGKEHALFSGDTLITDSGGNVGYSGKSMSYDLKMTKESVATRLKDLNFEILLPGHGPPIASGASDKVRKLLASRA